MNGNDRYDDHPRRSRRPDPLTDPWPVRREAAERRTGASVTDYDGRGYRDDYGGGRRRRRAAVPPDDAWRYPSDGGSAGRPDEAERPRGRRRRPGPADTGSFPIPPSEEEALRERPRGRRHRSASEDAPPPPHRGSESVTHTVERPSGRRRREAADPRSTDRDPGSDGADDRSAARSRRRSAPERRERAPSRASRREAAFDADEDTGAFALPFEDEKDEEPPRRSRRDSGARRDGRRPGSRRRRRKRRKSRAALMSAVLVLILFVGAAGTGGYLVLRTYVIPPDYSGTGTGEVDVLIEEGDSGTAIAEKLHEAGVVASVRAFTNEIRFSDSNFVPGTYQLRERMSAEAAIDMLLDPGTRVGLRVTIREGLRSATVLEELAEQTEIPLEDFQAAYDDHDALALPDYVTEGPEGYLYPETYEFGLDASATDILKQMVAQHRRVAADLRLEARAEENGFDPNEIMAIAAIVQAESGRLEDMGKVSRVVYNRLEVDMALQMDSTCFYALDEYGIAMSGEQQRRCEASDSEYKTYFRKGLPIGPIVNPGEDAIEAALAPEEGPWRYFVTVDPENGVTKFTESEAEFWDLVEEFNQSQGE